MNDRARPVFDDIPRTAGGHFALNVYAAVFRLLNHVRRLEAVGGPGLEAACEAYPFLGRYFVEMRRHLPEQLTWQDALPWWERRLEEWAVDAPEHLPLAAASRDLSLPFASRLALLITGLVEEDSRFGTLFADLAAPLASRRPTLELLGRILGDDAAPAGGKPADAWSLCRPLLAAGLVEAINRDDPRSEWMLRVPPLLWDVVRGERKPRPAPWCEFLDTAASPPIDRLIQPAELLERLAHVPRLVARGRIRTLVVRADAGADPVEVLGAVARELGRDLLVADRRTGHGDVLPGQVGPLATLTGALPVLRCEPGPGETVELPPLAGYHGPLGVTLGFEGGLAGALADRAVTITLPPPRADLRRRHWRRAMAGRPLGDIERIVDRFQLSGRYIGDLAGIAIAEAELAGRDEVQLPDVTRAARTLNRQLLDTLAAHVAVSGGWDDLVAGEATSGKLLELELRCRRREHLLDTLGPAYAGGAGRGVRALLTGASGTGKSLAARILAASLGMDLYRVDLAAVVNKYIGETEKNLHRVLSRAEALDVILLLDEGDALLGRRTDVRSANDRYANLETNYLLQRLENYDGIVLVTTNLGEAIDQAFRRRMDVVVPFFAPGPVERWRILQLHLPPDHAVDAGDLERLAVRCALNGGQLRNACLHAALQAVGEGVPVSSRHLVAGYRNEYRKAGGAFPLASGSGGGRRDGGMTSFIAAFERGG